MRSKRDPNNPLSIQNILAGVIVTIVGGFILAYIIQDARFAFTGANIEASQYQFTTGDLSHEFRNQATYMLCHRDSSYGVHTVGNLYLIFTNKGGATGTLTGIAVTRVAPPSDPFRAKSKLILLEASTPSILFMNREQLNKLNNKNEQLSVPLDIEPGGSELIHVVYEVTDTGYSKEQALHYQAELADGFSVDVAWRVGSNKEKQLRLQTDNIYQNVCIGSGDAFDCLCPVD